MRIIHARNVADAWSQAVAHARQLPAAVGTRDGAARVSPVPVTTVYARPAERVLLDPWRDANPFFHLMEALWMLAGRDDADWLDQFVTGFSARFAEEGGRMHGAYGKRWHDHFFHPTLTQDNWGPHVDQLDEVVRLLRENPADRQAVISMWDPSSDLGVPGLKDRPCNTHAYLRVREVLGEMDGHKDRLGHRVLDLTVCCRSNDAVMGCYGANAVHFSVLQEYLAARIGVGVGVYYQVSNNWHFYERDLPKMSAASASRSAAEDYPGTRPLVDDPETFDEELRAFMSDPTAGGHAYRNTFLGRVAHPMWMANSSRRSGDWSGALLHAADVEAPDWRRAAVEWLQRRRK